MKLLLFSLSLSLSMAFPTCLCEKAICLVVNITDGHILLRAEPRSLEHSSSANVHLLAFPDVPLCVHVRTAGEAVTETLPQKQSRGKEELRKSVTEKLHQEFNPLTKRHLKTQTCCWTKLLTQFKLLMCPANNGWSDPRPENHLNINMDISPQFLVLCVTFQKISWTNHCKITKTVYQMVATD